MSSAIKTAKMLSEGMGHLRDELLTDLDSSGKRALFEEAVQILIAQADAAQTADEALALADNIYRLADETPELRARLFGHPPRKPQLDFPDSAKRRSAELDAQNQKSLEAMPGIRQHLLRVVEDKKPPPTNDPQTLFDKILAKLGLQRIP